VGPFRGSNTPSLQYSSVPSASHLPLAAVYFGLESRSHVGVSDPADRVGVVRGAHSGGQLPRPPVAHARVRLAHQPHPLVAGLRDRGGVVWGGEVRDRLKRRGDPGLRRRSRRRSGRSDTQHAADGEADRGDQEACRSGRREGGHHPAVRRRPDRDHRSGGRRRRGSADEAHHRQRGDAGVPHPGQPAEPGAQAADRSGEERAHGPLRERRRGQHARLVGAGRPGQGGQFPGLHRPRRSGLSYGQTRRRGAAGNPGRQGRVRRDGQVPPQGGARLRPAVGRSLRLVHPGLGGGDALRQPHRQVPAQGGPRPPVRAGHHPQRLPPVGPRAAEHHSRTRADHRAGRRRGSPGAGQRAQRRQPAHGAEQGADQRAGHRPHPGTGHDQPRQVGHRRLHARGARVHALVLPLRRDGGLHGLAGQPGLDRGRDDHHQGGVHPAGFGRSGAHRRHGGARSSPGAPPCAWPSATASPGPRPPSSTPT